MCSLCLKNKKGFTLIEMLVTITVLIVILFLAVPTIITTMDRSKNKQYEGVIKSVETAASEYVTNNKNEFRDLINIGDKACIELSQLKEEGLIDKKLINPKIDEEFPNDLGTLIKVDIDNKLTYRVLEGNCATVNNIVLDLTVGVRTSSSIGVIVDANTTSEEVVGYYYSKDNGATWTTIQTTNQYVFNDLEKNKEYTIKVRAVDINEMDGQATITAKTTNINVPTYTASTSNWTSGNITVTIHYPGNKEDNWKYEYKKDNGNWTEARSEEEEVLFSKNGTVIGRIVDAGNNNNTVTSSLFEVTKIDSEAPSIASVVLNSITSSSIKVVASANATASGIKGYYFSKDNGATWTTIQTTNTYTFTGLTKNTTYPIKVKVVNNVDRETTSNVVNGKTTNITLPTYTANPSTWTSGNVIVTITYPSSKESGWTYQYQKDGGSWTTVSGTSQAVTFTANGYVIARITDGTNTVTASLFEVSKIDKTGPSIASVTINSRTSSSITAVASASDNESGIKGYYFSKDNGVTWTGIQYTNTYTFPGLIKGTTYPVKVKVVNNVDKETTSNAVNGTTTNITAPTYAINPTGWTNGNATVTVTYPSSKEANWVYQYQKDGGAWTTISGTSQALTFTANGSVMARIIDGTNTVTGSVFGVNNIDKVLPTINTPTITNVTQAGFTINVSGADYESGLKAYAYYVLINGGWVLSGYTTSTSHIVTGLNSNTYYVVLVEAHDNAGNLRQATQIGITTLVDSVELAKSIGGYDSSWSAYINESGYMVVASSSALLNYSESGTPAYYHQLVTTIKPKAIGGISGGSSGASVEYIDENGYLAYGVASCSDYSTPACQSFTIVKTLPIKAQAIGGRYVYDNGISHIRYISEAGYLADVGIKKNGEVYENPTSTIRPKVIGKFYQWTPYIDASGYMFFLHGITSTPLASNIKVRAVGDLHRINSYMYYVTYIDESGYLGFGVVGTQLGSGETTFSHYKTLNIKANAVAGIHGVNTDDSNGKWHILYVNESGYISQVEIDYNETANTWDVWNVKNGVRKIKQ